MVLLLTDVGLGGSPSIVVVAGPNGAGKSTLAPFLLRDALAVLEFVNADQIAAGLSVFHPESVAVAADRLMLARLAELARQRVSFGFETTLASRSFAPWLRARIADGYTVQLVFLWLASPEIALARVAGRVARGGHGVPDGLCEGAPRLDCETSLACTSLLQRTGGYMTRVRLVRPG